MEIITLHDKSTLEKFLRKDTFLHIYEIGDLDDYFWKYTSWYGILQNDKLQEVALLFTGLSTPTFLFLSSGGLSAKEFLLSVQNFLPSAFYMHISTGLYDILSEKFKLVSHGKHYKMSLVNKEIVQSIESNEVIQLNMDDRKEILDLYSTSYPGNWFELKMLQTGMYYGLKKDGKLESIAGVHVFSKDYKVAALGNITTHPDYRARGFGTSVTAMLCKNLLKHVTHIGLNVKQDNHAAIKCYKSIGFEITSEYEEFTVEKR
ncbi:MAG: GNAT family N-acetyltransferase [Candidatus Coatesbacteria bacterium]|nr:GNAT family N-acetyltransferase [Candidatus Coatesbacteria bacterium]